MTICNQVLLQIILAVGSSLFCAYAGANSFDPAADSRLAYDPSKIIGPPTNPGFFSIIPNTAPLFLQGIEVVGPDVVETVTIAPIPVHYPKERPNTHPGDGYATLQVVDYQYKNGDGSEICQSRFKFHASFSQSAWHLEDADMLDHDPGAPSVPDCTGVRPQLDFVATADGVIYETTTQNIFLVFPDRTLPNDATWRMIKNAYEQMGHHVDSDARRHAIASFGEDAAAFFSDLAQAAAIAGNVRAGSTASSSPGAAANSCPAGHPNLRFVVGGWACCPPGEGACINRVSSVTVHP